MVVALRRGIRSSEARFSVNASQSATALLRLRCAAYGLAGVVGWGVPEAVAPDSFTSTGVRWPGRSEMF